jgi:hypothetical protein
MLSLPDFIVVVYCLVSDVFTLVVGDQRLRRRGPPPRLTDSEAITMEIVGEYLGYDTDKGIWPYFTQHWRPWFPRLGSRSQFGRQASDLWRIKQLIQQALARHLGAFEDDIHLIDGHPMPVCVLTRKARCKRFRGCATTGYGASKHQYYYGLHGHLLVTEAGVITSYTVTGATIDEREAAWDMLDEIVGYLLGDKGYISAFFKDQLHEVAIQLETSKRKNMQDDCPPHLRNLMSNIRRRIETVVGQLSERLHIEKVWARDIWHLTNRIARKLLAHTVAVFINRQFGREPLQFDGLLA